MLSEIDKPFPPTLWWERDRLKHGELLSSGEAMQAEPTLKDKAQQEEAKLTLEEKVAKEKVAKVQAMLMSMMGLIRQLEPDLKIKQKLLITEPEPEPEPELIFKEKRLLQKPVPSEEKLKQKLLLPEPELIFKKKRLPQKPVFTLDEVETVTDTDTDTETEREFTVAKNVLQVEQVTDTDSETETESDIETEPELTVEEMLQLVEPDPELTMEEKVLQGLHLTCCKEFTEYDPRNKAFVCTRFCSFNIAFFDLDEESEAIHGQPLQELSNSEWRSIVQSSVNVISVKVLESDEGYPINVFGTVIARDEVDYKCVYLFNRGRDDPQYISSAEDMLTLTDPSRGFALSDRMFFEINLKMKGDDISKDRDLSKGVIEHCRVPLDKRPVTELLSSWLSTVELVYTPVPYPVAATIKVNILDGPCDVPFNGRITAWTTGNAESYITLYEYDDSKATGARALIDNAGSLVLTRKLVAVPVPIPKFDDDGEGIVINVCFITSNGENERTPVTLQYPQEAKVCNHGSYELEVKVEWTAIFTRPMSKDIHRRWCSVPTKLPAWCPES